MSELTSPKSIKQKKTILFVVLSGFFICNALLAEIIGVKIFSLEKTLHLPAAGLHFLNNQVLDFNLTAGVLLWPVVFIITDLINEYFGKDAVKKLSILACFIILYAFVAIWLSTELEPADFWLEVNKQGPQGSNFDINYSFQRIFSQGLSIITGSLVAFILGQMLDAYVFHYLKKATSNKMLWLRATGSTLISQLIDSFLVLFIAFYLLAGPNKWTFNQVISVGLLNYTYKFIIATVLTPLLYVLHSFIDKYLGIKELQKPVKRVVEQV